MEMEETFETMEQYERKLMDANDDDWYVPDCSLDYIGVHEYRIYLRECGEMNQEYV